MISLKSPRDIDGMEVSGRLVAECLAIARDMVKPGISTAEINEAVERNILDHGAKAAFKGFPGPKGVKDFPAACCMSVDEEVVHGIPNNKPLHDGQIVSIDIGVLHDGWYGDAARTFAVGNVSPEIKKLMDATWDALHLAIEIIKPGQFLSNIGYTIQTHVEQLGFSVVRELVGHGIGKDLHEEPQVPNYGRLDRGLRLREGMVIAVEPMINLGVYQVKVLNDGWTIVTADGKASAHYEHTIAVTADGARVLTLDP
ncbi:type I methionyl aminopeptidase [bacterium]|nr:type I methionyl aminopeptidase [bacterium]